MILRNYITIVDGNPVKITVEETSFGSSKRWIAWCDHERHGIATVIYGACNAALLMSQKLGGSHPALHPPPPFISDADAKVLSRMFHALMQASGDADDPALFATLANVCKNMRLGNRDKAVEYLQEYCKAQLPG